MLIDRYGVQLPTPYISTNNASSISINILLYSIVFIHGALCVPAKLFELRILFPPPCGLVRCGRGRPLSGPTLGLRCPGLGWAGQWPP